MKRTISKMLLTAVLLQTCVGLALDDVASAAGANRASSNRDVILVRKFFQQAWGGEIETLDSFVSPSYVDHNGWVLDRNGLRRQIETTRWSFPNFHRDAIRFKLLDGRVIATSYVSGYLDAPFLDLPALHRSVGAQVIDMFRIAGGKIVEHWSPLDQTVMLRQAALTLGNDEISIPPTYR